MALADFVSADRPSVIAALVRSVSGLLDARRTARAQAAALNDLMSMPEHRLRDLGIDPRTLHQALDARHWPTRK